MNLRPPLPRPPWGDGSSSDHWSSYLHGSPWPKEASPFRIPMRELIRRAELELHWRESDGELPLVPKVRVTDFAKWIFELYDPGPRPEQLAAGRRIEAAVDTYSLRQSLMRLRLRPTRCIISHRHSKRVTRCSDTPPRTINITAQSAERIAGSLSGPRPYKATIVAVS
jgi:hypothetical protein